MGLFHLPQSGTLQWAVVDRVMNFMLPIKVRIFCLLSEGILVPNVLVA